MALEGAAHAWPGARSETPRSCRVSARGLQGALRPPSCGGFRRRLPPWDQPMPLLASTPPTASAAASAVASPPPASLATATPASAAAASARLPPAAGPPWAGRAGGLGIDFERLAAGVGRLKLGGGHGAGRDGDVEAASGHAASADAAPSGVAKLANDEDDIVHFLESRLRANSWYLDRVAAVLFGGGADEVGYPLQAAGSAAAAAATLEESTAEAEEHAAAETQCVAAGRRSRGASTATRAPASAAPAAAAAMAAAASVAAAPTVASKTCPAGSLPRIQMESPPPVPRRGSSQPGHCDAASEESEEEDDDRGAGAQERTGPPPPQRPAEGSQPAPWREAAAHGFACLEEALSRRPKKGPEGAYWEAAVRRRRRRSDAEARGPRSRPRPRLRATRPKSQPQMDAEDEEAQLYVEEWHEEDRDDADSQRRFSLRRNSLSPPLPGSPPQLLRGITLEKKHQASVPALAESKVVSELDGPQQACPLASSAAASSPRSSNRSPLLRSLTTPDPTFHGTVTQGAACGDGGHDGIQEESEEDFDLHPLDLLPEDRLPFKLRGISAGQLEEFFSSHCGDVICDRSDLSMPVCMSTKLSELCARSNMQALLGKSKRRRPYAPNTHAVADLVVGPATLGKGVSYAEFLNSEGLSAVFFVSHHWDEDFGELAQGVLRHAVAFLPTLSLASWREATYWLCVFALDQNRVRFHGTLEHSAFVAGLSSSTCRGTVLSLNHAASALTRAWCLVEVYLTHHFGKELVLSSSVGPLMNVTNNCEVKDAWAASVFRLLQHIDFSSAATSIARDKRKIVDALHSCPGLGLAEDCCYGLDQVEGHGAAAALADVLNPTLKAVLAQQALFALARQGDAAAVGRALDLSAAADAPDAFGVRALTFAAAAAAAATAGGGVGANAAADREAAADARAEGSAAPGVARAVSGAADVVELLLSRGADARAARLAPEVLAMWSPQRQRRLQAQEALQGLDDTALAAHGEALRKGQSWDATLAASEYAAILEKTNLRPSWSAPRAEAARLLGEQRTAALPYVTKLMCLLTDMELPLREIAVVALAKLGPHVRDLPPCVLAEVRLREASLSLEVSKRHRRNVLQLAVADPSGNAFHVLTRCIHWPRDRASDALMAKDKDHRTLAHLCIAHRNAAFLRRLVEECGMPVSVMLERDGYGRNAAHLAAKLGNDAALREVIQLAQMTPYQLRILSEAKGRNVAHLAVLGGHVNCLRTLVEHCGFKAVGFLDEDLDGCNVVHLAAAHGHSECLRVLARDLDVPTTAYWAVDKGHRMPAHRAVFGQHLDTLRALIECHAPVHMPLGPATKKIGSAVLVRVDPDLTTPVWHFFYVAKEVDRWGSLTVGRGKCLTQECRKTRPEKCIFAPTPLVLAEKLGFAPLVSLLKNCWKPVIRTLGASSDMWAEARRGCLPAGFLVRVGAFQALQQLVKAGGLSLPYFKMLDFEGRSPLHRAVAYDVPEEGLRVVVDAGEFSLTELAAKDAGGRNVAHIAAATGDAELMRSVINVVEANFQVLAALDDWGRSPAHIAAASDAADVLRVLAEFRAPLELHAGPPSLEVGSFCLLTPSQAVPKSSALRFARIASVRGRLVTLHCEGGTVEEDVPESMLTLAPTPRMLAACLSNARATAVFFELLGPPPECALHQAKRRSSVATGHVASSHACNAGITGDALSAGAEPQTGASAGSAAAQAVGA